MHNPLRTRHTRFHTYASLAFNEKWLVLDWIRDKLGKSNYAGIGQASKKQGNCLCKSITDSKKSWKSFYWSMVDTFYVPYTFIW